MKKGINSNFEAGSRKKANEPRHLSEILAEYFEGNSPLARAYRDRLSKKIHPHMEMDVDLKPITRQPGRIDVGAMIDDALTHDARRPLHLYSECLGEEEGWEHTQPARVCRQVYQRDDE